jgi:hypothetical protein
VQRLAICGMALPCCMSALLWQPPKHTLCSGSSACTWRANQYTCIQSTMVNLSTPRTQPQPALPQPHFSPPVATAAAAHALGPPKNHCTWPQAPIACADAQRQLITHSVPAQPQPQPHLSQGLQACLYAQGMQEVCLGGGAPHCHTL